MMGLAKSRLAAWALAPLALLFSACTTAQNSTGAAAATVEQMSGWIGQDAAVAVTAWGPPQWEIAAADGTKKWGPGALAAHDPENAKAMVWLFQHSDSPKPCDPLKRPYQTTFDPDLGRHTGVIDSHSPCNLSRVIWVDGNGVIYNWRAD